MFYSKNRKSEVTFQRNFEWVRNSMYTFVKKILKVETVYTQSSLFCKYDLISNFYLEIQSRANITGTPKGDSKSRFHASLSHKSRPEKASNSCSRQVYPITLDARLIIHTITQLFLSNSRFHVLKYDI